MSKDDAVKITKNSNLNGKSGFLQFFLHYIKISEITYYQRNRETVLNITNDYIKNNKEKLRE